VYEIFPEGKSKSQSDLGGSFRMILHRSWPEGQRFAPKWVRGGGEISLEGWVSMGARGGREAKMQCGEKVGEGFWVMHD
jgi:hypothetical protein